jgi:hypothetical protein
VDKESGGGGVEETGRTGSRVGQSYDFEILLTLRIWHIRRGGSLGRTRAPVAGVAVLRGSMKIRSACFISQRGADKKENDYNLFVFLNK